MKTGNGASPNPKGIFQKGMKKDDCNVEKASTGKPFSAKKDIVGKGHLGPVGKRK
jgi:hypothetical protein